MKISEIFTSIQGESTFCGLPCTFIRMAGCNLQCRYCDTTYAREGGEELTLDQIVKRVKDAGISLIELTGGEPLLQEECYLLIEILLKEGYDVLIETNGSLPLEKVDSRVIKIVDIKCPGSNQASFMDWDNIARLREGDEIKFVISERPDFDFAMATLQKYPDLMQHPIHLSPNLSELTAEELAEWILNAKSPVRLQLQLHKILKMK